MILRLFLECACPLSTMRSHDHSRQMQWPGAVIWSEDEWGMLLGWMRYEESLLTASCSSFYIMLRKAHGLSASSGAWLRTPYRIMSLSAPAPWGRGQWPLHACGSPGRLSLPLLLTVPFVDTVVSLAETHKTKDSCLARQIRCPRGKEENTTVASLNRKSEGRFWCVHHQVFPQFTTWFQDYVYATQDHLGCRNID